ALGEERTLLLWFDWPLGYLMEGCLDSLMADPHAPVNQLFYGDPLRTNTVLYLIELAVELDGMVILEGPFRLYAENCIKINVGRAMQVLFLLRLYRKAFVIDRQIGDHESVCLVYRAHSLKSHLLDHAVLERVEEALDPPFGLGGVGMELSDPEFR